MRKRKDYVVIGKMSELNFDSIVNQAQRNFSRIDSRVIKVVVTTGLALVVAGAIETTTGFAATQEVLQNQAIEVAGQYKNPSQLSSIVEFVDWLIQLIRWLVSMVIGLIATYAGYRWATDISGSGVSEAKKILKNSAIGAFWVQFGGIIANFFISKLQSFL